MADLQRDLFRNPGFLMVNGLTCPAPTCDQTPAARDGQDEPGGDVKNDSTSPRPQLQVVGGPELPIVPHRRPRRLQRGFVGNLPPEHALKISVITSCQDNVRSVGACLASVQAQSHPSVEHVVVDLDSTDGSLQRIMRDRYRLTIVFGRRSDCLFASWNRGICHANGDVVGFLNATDVYPDPSVLSRVAQAFEDPDVSAVYGHAQHRPPGLQPAWQPPMVVPRVQKRELGWAPALDTLFVRRQWLEQIRALATELPLAADFDAVQRLFALPGFRAVCLDMPVVGKPAPPSPWHTPWLHWRHTLERLACLQRLEREHPAKHPWRTLRRLFFMLRHSPPVTGLRS